MKYLLYTFIYLIFLSLISETSAFSFNFKKMGLKESGRFRNDFIFLKKETETFYSDVFETQYVLRKRQANWKFYSDFRLYFFGGEISKFKDKADLEVMRAFFRFYPRKGFWTIGKTYINFGNTSVFNPFEIDKSLNLSDLNYAKEGIFAIEYNYPLKALSGIKYYIVPEKDSEKSQGGINYYNHVKKFDYGFVFNRYETKNSVFGVYFKGDMPDYAVQSAFAYHLENNQDNFIESNIGIDFSKNDLIVTLMYYYNASGINDKSLYLTANSAGFFKAKDYVYLNLTYTVDEFFSYHFDSFVNLVDNSKYFIPYLRYKLVNDWDLLFQVYKTTGEVTDEFNKNIYGKYGALLRLETKF